MISQDLTRRQALKMGLVLPALYTAYGRDPLPGQDFDLLQEIERRACLYFYEQAHPVTGLVKDRANSNGSDDRRVASIAATGFGLSALCIADQRGFLKRGEAKLRVLATLEFLEQKMPHHHGFFYHFVDFETGERMFRCEVSSIDTAWLLCGVLHARTHFDDKKVRRSANRILGRVDWVYMLDGEETLTHGWTPEAGFLRHRWDEYSELLAMYLLAVSSPSHPIPAASWDAWERPTRVLPGHEYIDSPAPLFVHQYSHAWFDFRNRQDEYANYFSNSRLATEAHREFCLRLKDRFPWMGPELWGVTASDSRHGYVDWGGPSTAERIDGTVVPCAAGGSVVFLPEQCLLVLRTMLDRYGKGAWGRYGFVDAFHPGEGWYNPDVIGIDLGIMLLMAENYRTGSVWEAVMSTPEAKRAMQLASFVPAAV